MSNPKIKVQGAVSDFAQKTKAVKPRYSNYFLTINTNQHFKDDDPDLENDTAFFSGVVENVLGNIDKYLKLPEGHTFENNVQDVNIDYVVEKGTKKGFLHCHMYLKFTHNTDLKLNYVTLKKKFCDELGLPNLHMKNLIVKSNNENVLEYLGKYQKK